MSLLIIDPTYPEHEENYEKFAEQLSTELTAEFGKGTKFTDIDAGPGASISAFLVDVLGVTGGVIAILGLPALWEQNRELWKAKFDGLVSFLISRKLKFNIDFATAQQIAAFFVLNKFAKVGGYDELRVVSVTHFWSNLNGCHSEYISEFSETFESSDSNSSMHIAACKQVQCHYYVCIEIDYEAWYALVDGQGNCLKVGQL